MKRTKAQLVFEKLARFNVTDFENDYLSGVMLSDAGESKAKQMYAKKQNESFVLQHPYLTGIPTLGIAPAIAKDNAQSEIARKLLQESAKLRKERDKAKKYYEKVDLEKYKAQMMAPKPNVTHVQVASDNRRPDNSK